MPEVLIDSSSCVGVRRVYEPLLHGWPCHCSGLMWALNVMPCLTAEKPGPLSQSSGPVVGPGT